MKYNIDQVFGVPLVKIVLEDDTSELLEHNHTNEFHASRKQLLENPKWYDTWKYNTKEISQPKPKTNWKKSSPKKIVANNAPVGKNMDLFKELFGNEAKEKN